MVSSVGTLFIGLTS